MTGQATAEWLLLRVNSTLRPGYRRLPLWTISRRPIRRITGYARLDRSSRAVISAAGSFRRTSSLLGLEDRHQGRVAGLDANRARDPRGDQLSLIREDLALRGQDLDLDDKAINTCRPRRRRRLAGDARKRDDFLWRRPS
jgi:hypothetical protein